MIKILTFLSFISMNLYSMDIDSKFIARILGVSDSKKTVLLNKGSEIGLKEGDHAKFSLPTGMIARGVLVKLAPSRSVWSLYRISSKERIVAQVSMTLKIASAVKLTVDESKNLGILAEKYGKKEEKEPTETKVEKAEQKELKQDMIKSEYVISQFDKEDYSALEDDGAYKKPDKDIDWMGLDGKYDAEFVDTGMDYSSLK